MSGNIDAWKLHYTYAAAWVVIVGGGAMLFVSRLEGATDFQIVLAGFIGFAVQFLFGQEAATRATRAAEKAHENARTPLEQARDVYLDAQDDGEVNGSNRPPVDTVPPFSGDRL